MTMAGYYDPFGYGADAGPNVWNAVPNVDPTQTGSVPNGPLAGTGVAHGPLSGSGGGGFLSGLRGLLDPQYALPIAAQLIGGATPQASFAGALGAAGPAIGDIRKRAAINAWLKSRSTGEPLSAEAQKMISEDPQLAQKLAEHDLALGATAHNKYGLTPVWLKGPHGPVLGQLNEAGGMTPVDTGGMEPLDPMQYLNTGTGFVPAGKHTGPEGAAAQGAGAIPIDVAGAAAAGQAGKGQGDALVAWRSMKSKLPGLQTVVTQLNDLSEKATYTSTGQLIDWTRNELGAAPRDSAVARTKYIAIVNNQILPLLRDTFGAAFTEREGNSLKVTMGDPDLSPTQKQAVLKAFIEQKQRDIEAAAVQSGQSEPAATGAPADAPAAGVVKAEDFFK
jgi:hypothetical protein